MLNHEQADAVLDVFDQCLVVWQAWEQKSAHDRTRKAPHKGTDGEAVAQSVLENYHNATVDLTHYYLEARKIDVSKEMLLAAIRTRLPAVVYGAIAEAV